jgi:hypothetical protein
LTGGCTRRHVDAWCLRCATNTESAHQHMRFKSSWHQRMQQKRRPAVSVARRPCARRPSAHNHIARQTQHSVDSVPHDHTQPNRTPCDRTAVCYRQQTYQHIYFASVRTRYDCLIGRGLGFFLDRFRTNRSVVFRKEFQN